MAAGPQPEPGAERTLSQAENTPPLIQSSSAPKARRALVSCSDTSAKRSEPCSKPGAELERIQRLRYQIEVERAAVGAYARAVRAQNRTRRRDAKTSLPPSLPPENDNQPPARPQQTPTVPHHLSRAERRAIERVQRKAAKRATHSAVTSLRRQMGPSFRNRATRANCQPPSTDRPEPATAALRTVQTKTATRPSDARLAYECNTLKLFATFGLTCYSNPVEEQVSGETHSHGLQPID